MKITKSQVTKIILSGLNGLDNVAVYLEDFAPGEGKLIITCFSSSWTYYWGHMGKQHNLSSFIRKASVDYLAGKLMNGAAEDVPDLDKTIAHAKSIIINNRKKLLIGKDDARELFNLASDQQELTIHANDWEQIFGEEYWYHFQTSPSPDWVYLCKVVDAVKSGLDLDAELRVAA
jgi:hypothetical protein